MAEVVLKLRAGGKLADRLGTEPGVGFREVKAVSGQTLREILAMLGVPEGAVACAFVDGSLKRLNYQPRDGEEIKLQPPVTGG